eukprot:353707-Chlamydomonas_euryale.AAC.10
MRRVGCSGAVRLQRTWVMPIGFARALLLLSQHPFHPEGPQRSLCKPPSSHPTLRPSLPGRILTAAVLPCCALSQVAF